MIGKLSIRPWILGVAATALVATGAYGLVWRAGAAEIRERINAFAHAPADARQAARLAYRDLSTGGFPFFLRVDLDAPEIASADGLSWRAEELSVHAVPHKPSHLAAKARGQQIISWRDGAGQRNEWTLSPDASRASLSRENDRERFVIELKDATAAQTAGGALQGDVAFSLLQISVDRPLGAAPRDDNLLAGVAVQGLRIAPRAGGLALDAPIAIDSSYAVLEIPASDFAGQAIDGAALTRWLADQPAFRLAAFEMTAGPLIMAARGMLNIDATGHIAGEITARLNNVESFVAMLAGDGQITEEQRDGIIATLTLVGAAQNLSSTDRAQGLELPLTAQSGRLYVGPVAIAEIPKVSALLSAN